MSAEAVIYIVDDEDAVRVSLATLLEVHGFTTQAFRSGDDFLKRIDAAKPGCALVDLRMPGLDGISLLRKMAESNIHLPVVMMTGFGDVAMAVAAMKAGAADFLEKPLDEADLLKTLRRLIAHSQVVLAADEHQEQKLARLSRLTEREREVFDRLAVGMTNKGIALDLGISPRTIEIHRARIMEKLEARTLSDLVRLTLASGLRQERMP